MYSVEMSLWEKCKELYRGGIGKYKNVGEVKVTNELYLYAIHIWGLRH